MSLGFNYQTLRVRLHPPTKSLVVTFCEEGGYLEKLFELEGLLNWCLNKIEITSLLLQFENSAQCLSPLSDEFLRMDTEKVNKLAKRYQRLAELLLLLPATTLVDVGQGAGGFGQDWLLACDLVVGHESGIWSFKGASMGLPLFAGALVAFSSFGIERQMRSFSLTEGFKDLKTLGQMGLNVYFYSQDLRNEKIAQILRDLGELSPLVRLQQKKAALSLNYQKIEEAKKIESNILAQALISEDWKVAAKSLVESSMKVFMPAKEMAQVIREL